MSHSELHWDYSNDGIRPNEWPKYYPTGDRQSPINILVNEELIRSTCCAGLPMLSTPGAAGAFVGSGTKCTGPQLLTSQLAAKRRSHLDSVGEDHQRSSSASSASSASSSSSSLSSSSSSSKGKHHSDEAVDSEDYDEDEHNARSVAKRGESARQQKQVRGGIGNSGTPVALTQNTRYCVSNRKLFLGYPRYLGTVQLCNTGHNWQVNLPSQLSTHTLLAGPPLGNREYRLAQFHCHWGKTCDQGSEHQINSESFAAEIHFVHWNCTDYSSMEEASKQRHGLAALGVFVQALDGDQYRNKHMEKIIKGLKSVTQKPGSCVDLHARLDLKKLFPANRWTYANYEGSLTTPPLSEAVDWIVFLNPIRCSSTQIEQFRRIRTKSGDNLIDNCRPIQPTNERVVSIWSHNHQYPHPQQ